MSVERRKNFIINFVYLVIVSLIVFVVFKYGIFWFLPFIIGFAIAFLLKPLINLITSKLKMNRKFVASITLLLLYATIGTLLTLLGMKLFISLKNVFITLPHVYMTSIEPALTILYGNIETLVSALDPTVVDSLKVIRENLSQSLIKVVTFISSNAVNTITGIAGSIPVVIISFIITLLSSIFIALDYYQITSFITRQFPDKIRTIIFDIKDYIVGTVFKLIKAYAIIMTITFVELSIGFLILGINNAIAVAGLIAIVDVLPVLGTGGVVIPWIVIEIIKGNFSFAIGLLIIYLVVTFIRNMIEPKVVGQQIGLHPLVTLMSMFIGVKIFGVLGIFILPLIVIILKNLNDTGKIHIFK